MAHPQIYGRVMESDDKNVCRLLVKQNNLFCRVLP